MSFPHTLINWAAASGLWWGAHWIFCFHTSADVPRPSAAFAIAGSAYGSLAARLIRDSLHSYWHGGESYSRLDGKVHESPSKSPNFFLRSTHAKQVHELNNKMSFGDGLWIDGLVNVVDQLEKKRTKRSSHLPFSNAHHHFLNAAADMRLRFAYELDPSDSTLYEILHFHILSRSDSSVGAQLAAEMLAKNAITHALHDQAGLCAALTGAGAAINLLNLQWQLEPSARDELLLTSHLKHLEQCLVKYERLRANALDEGWWSEISDVRRKEIEDYAQMLNRVYNMFKKTVSPGASQ
jgi:hypothetical protein